jgi:hypothetical protein
MHDSTAFQLETPLSHSQMLKTRRTKQKTKKRLAGVAKRAKKLKKKDVKMVSADAGKKELS